MSILKASLAFRELDHGVAAFQLIFTLLSYFGSLYFAILTFDRLYLSLPFMVVCGLSAVRLYMLQHDCMHRCFVSQRWLNDLIGVLLSPFTLSPFFVCKHNHGLHHSHIGDLDRRETFEINVLTVEEFRNLSTLKKISYRLYRSPFILLVVGPFLVYAIVHRFPKNTLKGGFLWDVLAHNILLLGFVFLISTVSGWSGVIAWLISVYFGVSLGAFIPYVEHNFEDVHWGRKPDLDFQTAALEGSAVLDFGDVFHFVTANIGFHDLHHLNPKVPSYRLKTCYEKLEDQGLIQSRKIQWGEAVSSLRWKLWDEKNQKMVTFAAA